jgi:hypothetical protein
MPWTFIDDVLGLGMGVVFAQSLPEDMLGISYA